MKQIVAFSSYVDIDLKDAIETAKGAFPNDDFSNIQTAEDLENKIHSMEQTLYVEIDTDKQVQASLEAEKTLKAEVDNDVENFNCPIDSPVLTEEDLKDTDFCGPIREFPEEIQVPEDELAAFVKTLDGIEEEKNKKINDVLKCVSSMKEITEQINVLNAKALDIKKLQVNLEQLFYNYRSISTYYLKKTERLEELLGIFDPLIRNKKLYEDEIELVTPQDAKAKDDLDKAIKKLKDQEAITGVAGAAAAAVSSTAAAVTGNENNAVSTTANNAATNIFGNNAVTQQDVDRLQAAYDLIHAHLLDTQAKLDEVNETIAFEESKVSPFLQEIALEKTDEFKGNTDEGREELRQKWIREQLEKIGGFSQGALGGLPIFTSRTMLERNSFSLGFRIIIEHDFSDPTNILASSNKRYLRPSQVWLRNVDQGKGDPSGALYETLYNIWGDTEKFFTREERGLTADGNLAQASLKGTGAEVFKNSFIKDSTKFSEFYQNFGANHANKVNDVKAGPVESALSIVQGNVSNIAKTEVEYILAGNRAFLVLPETSTTFTNIIDKIRIESSLFISIADELRKDLLYVENLHADTLNKIELKKQEYTGTPCSITNPPVPEKEPEPPGADPLGAETIQKIFPEDPDFTKWCYWLKFAKAATAVNVLPYTGAGGLKYWPIGLQIPNPSGVTNIPLPIVWLPITVIVLPVGIFVIFIGMCGICPSPFVLFIGTNGEKKFIVSLRPTLDFGSNASESSLKTVLKGGIVVPTPAITLLNNVNIPGFVGLFNMDDKDSVLADVKDKIFKKINKAELPDITPITSKLTTGSSIQDKKDALKEVIQAQFDKIVFPTLKIPKNGKNINPKLPSVASMLGELMKLLGMGLPNIAIPTIATINLKTKLISKIGELKIGELPSINIPTIDFSEATPEEIDKWEADVKKAMKSGIEVAHKKLNPKFLGFITSALANVPAVFINPYKCKPGATGLALPPIPGNLLAALAAILILAKAFIDGLSVDFLKKLTFKTGGAITADMLANLITSALGKLPDLKVPDPSKISIKDMLMSVMLQIATIDLPSIPIGPPQIQVPVPGAALKNALSAAVIASVDKLPIQDIDFTKIAAVDVKQILIGLIETSMKPVEDFLAPFLQIIAVFQAAKNLDFSKTLGLVKPVIKFDLVPVPLKGALEAALILLASLVPTPYPVVCLAPDVFKELHPMLTSDDLPPWKRLTLDNFLFVCFLDEFCQQGKKGGGFLENP